MASEYKDFRKLLKQYGYELRPERRHVHILSGERRVYTMSSSPKNEFQAIQNTVRDLVLLKVLPDNLVYRGRTYKRKRKAKSLYD